MLRHGALRHHPNQLTLVFGDNLTIDEIMHRLVTLPSPDAEEL
jgi:hypothetical protein